jgi:anaerobic magnesium-protoporphyrin IX monomethyl ester cyclase
MKIAFISDAFQKLGVQYISAVLKAGGHQTKLFVDPQLFDDMSLSVKSLGNFFDYRAIIIQQLKLYQPDLIVFSVVTDFYQRATLLAKSIKNELDIPILFGGNHPTLVPERVLANDCVDMVCIGEGEYPLLELVNSMEKGIENETIKNIWFKKKDKLIKNALRPLIKNLDQLPFPDQEIYCQASPHFKFAYFCAASRGCPNSCSYCFNSHLHSCYKTEDCFYHKRSVDSVIKELVVAKQKYRVKQVMFVDESFGHESDSLEEFSREYKNKVALPFYCNMYPGDITERLVVNLKQAGCVEISVGIQSWDQAVMRKMGRNVSVEKMKQALALVKANKISLVTEEIIGFPGQTEKSIINSAEIYNRIKPARAFLHPLKYYPNTGITKYAFAQGIIDPNNQLRIFDGVYGKSFQQGGDLSDQNQSRMLFLFFIARVLPGFLFKLIVNKKIYKFLPISFLLVLDNLFSSSVDTQIARLRALVCYGFFLKKFFYRGLNIKL